MYDESIALVIADRIAGGESLARICRDKGMPGRTSVYKWLRDEPQFAALMAQARLDQADSFADDILAIADNVKLDVDSRRVMVDARKWVAARFNRVKYGDKVDLDHTGNVTVNLNERGDDKL
jgi:hypothetical protein